MEDLERGSVEIAFQSVIDAIKAGVLDDRLKEIQKIIDLRQEIRKDEIVELVQEVFGPDATIMVEKTAILSNPFEKKAQNSKIDTDGQTKESDVNSNQSEDVLAHLDEVEREMEEEISSHEETPAVSSSPVEIPIEQRGASISGLHSSQIE